MEGGHFFHGQSSFISVAYLKCNKLFIYLFFALCRTLLILVIYSSVGNAMQWLPVGRELFRCVKFYMTFQPFFLGHSGTQEQICHTKWQYFWSNYNAKKTPHVCKWTDNTTWWFKYLHQRPEVILTPLASPDWYGLIGDMNQATSAGFIWCLIEPPLLVQTQKGNYSLLPLGIMHFTTTHVMHEHTQLAQAEIFQIKWHKGPKLRRKWFHILMFRTTQEF